MNVAETVTVIRLGLLEDAFDPGESEVVRERVCLIQRGPDGEAAQEVFRLQFVEIQG